MGFFLRRSAGQQLTHLICLKLLYVIFLNHKLLFGKEIKPNYFNIKLWNIFLYLCTELFVKRK